jgi:hypothetical protein
VIYIEHHNGPEQTDAGRIDWRPGWYVICDDCGWSAGPCLTEADAIDHADAHAVAMGEVTPGELAKEDRVIPDQELRVAWQIRHGQRPDGWWFALEVPGRPLEEHGPFDSEDAMLAAKVARIRELEKWSPSERPAEPGELCTCGREAIVVYLGSIFGPTGYCGIPDGGDRAGPCPFCGGPRHQEPEGRCPDYRLRLDQP